MNAKTIPAYAADELDLSVFMMAANAIIAIAIPLLLFYRGQNDYVNIYTVCLSLAFAAQNHFFLRVTKRRPDPFLLLLVFHAICFYEFRVATLLWDPWSVVLERNLVHAVDLSKMMLFIICANAAIFLGLTIQAGKPYEATRARSESGASIRLSIPALLFFSALVVERVFTNFPGLQGYFGVVLNPDVLLVFTMILLFLYRPVVSKLQLGVIAVMILAMAAERVLYGSRSALLTLLYYTFCAWFAVKGHVAFKRKVYVAVLLILPLSIALFVVGTRVHNARPDGQVPPRVVFDRLGFLDMSSEIAANSLQYRRVINFEHYFKSSVDSGFTPGFHIFDALKAANALSRFYRGIPDMSLKSGVAYQSDMMTLYGEAYVLFGPLAGLVWIFVVSFLFRKVYHIIESRDPFRTAVLRALSLFFFYYYFLNSYGIDWFIVDVARGVIPFFLLLYVFLKYVRRVPSRLLEN